MAGRHRTEVGPERLTDRRHGERRAPVAAPRRRVRLRLMSVFLLTAVAAGILLSGARTSRSDADELLGKQDVVGLTAVRLQALRVTELARLDVVDGANTEAVLATWRADLAELARRIPADGATPDSRAAAERLRAALEVDPEVLGTADPLLAARIRLLPTEPELAGPADAAAARVHALGVVADLFVAASAEPVTSVPWDTGDEALQQLTQVVGSWPDGSVARGQAPSAAYTASLTWSLGRLGLAGATPASEPSPLTVDRMTAETGRLVTEATRIGNEESAQQAREHRDAAAESRNNASFLVLVTAIVVGAALLLVVLILVVAGRDRRRAAVLARFDPLTGLRNRAGFADVVDRWGAEGSVAVALVDLDRFRPINDSLGRATGDELLVEVARRLEAASEPAGAVVARLSGDEFVLAMSGATDHEVDLVVVAVIEQLQVVEVNGLSVEVGCSVGVVHAAAGRSSSAQALLHEADLAMYRAKRSGGGRAVHVDDATRTALARFRDGTVGSVVDVGVRLQRSLDDRTIVGALVNPEIAGDDGAPIEGDDLRMIAEYSQHRFGTLDATIDGIARTGRSIPPAGIRLWFEVSAPDVVSYGGVDALWQRLSKVGLSGAKLGVELIDAGGQDADALIAAVAALRALGVHVAVRGTGPNAVGLAALTRLAVDRLVVDPSVVAAIRAGDAEVSRAVKAIADLGANLGAEVIATGVPSLDVAHTLRELGVEVVQVMVTEPWAPKRPAVPRGDSVVVE